MIISSESKKLYQQFKFINLNDKSKRLDSSICNMIRNDFKDDQNLYIDVLKFLNDNRKEILSKIKNKNNYKKIARNFNIIPNPIDIVHLNQIVNDLGQEKLINIKY